MQSFDFIKLITSISSSYTKCFVKESFVFFEASYRLNDFCRAGFKENLPICFSYFEGVDDDVIFQVDFSCGESFVSVGDFNNFVDEVDDWASVEEYDSVNIVIKIEKKVIDNCVNIYSLPDFEEFLKAQDLRDRFKSWADFDLRKKIFLISHRDFYKVTTPWIELLGACDKITAAECANNDVRVDYKSKRDSASHFANASEFLYLPEDFEVIDGLDTAFGEYLNSIYKSLLIVYLADFSEVYSTSIKYTLNGYKAFSDVLELKDLEACQLSELKGIYKYVFFGGNFTDKIGLARNIMSLHMHGAALNKLEAGTLDSVKSGYNVYLKDNVKQYIDIKNKLLEFLIVQSDKAAEVGRGLFSSFKMQFWAFSTFFVSVFLLRSLSKPAGDFIDETVVIPGIILVLVSFIYLFIMIREGRYEEKMIIGKFDDMELRYKDLLDERDLKTILASEENKDKVSRTIDAAIKTYRNAWVSTSILFLLVLFWWWKSTAGITWKEIFFRLVN